MWMSKSCPARTTHHQAGSSAVCSRVRASLARHRRRIASFLLARGMASCRPRGHEQGNISSHMKNNNAPGRRGTRKLKYSFTSEEGHPIGIQSPCGDVERIRCLRCCDTSVDSIISTMHPEDVNIGRLAEFLSRVSSESSGNDSCKNGNTNSDAPSLEPLHTDYQHHRIINNSP